ncbi:hypothetical protein QBC46DRAFT_436024 [Diplogelasinospora grovesii]|uniref:Uncharacterized protein n=1 Tax=Diplogelasinospora grovesii TaxID=303347 RepID=A0AAN6NJL2_9PEZI|nr:hypothetical protein QBC46DRAFT_436024 [Diplogelasinospora grovesii]
MSPFLGADGVVGWLESRGDSARYMGGSNVNDGSAYGLSQTATNATTQMIINEFRFAAAKSVRTSTIILASFNTIAAFATAMGILYDAYTRERRNNKNFKFSRNGFTFVPAAEVFPLVLSFGIVVQGISFAVAQSTGLNSLVGVGCTLIAELMLPAVFIAPYTQLVFAIEITLRGLRKQPFAPRGKWNVTICLTIIGLMILTNFLVADFDRSPNFCFTSLFWFVAHYSLACFALLTGIASALIICIVIIFVRLHRSIKIDVTERVAASRMVYYLALAIISNAFMIPYFFSMAFIDQTDGNSNALTLSMIASVVANVSGLMTGGLYLFLKSSTLSTIGPRDKIGEYENRRAKYKIRRFGSNDLEFNSHMMQPVSGPGSLRRTDSEVSLVSSEKELEIQNSNSSSSPTFGMKRLNSLRSDSIYPPSSATLREPEPVAQMSSAIGHLRKRSYSLFPNNAPSVKSSITLLPATTYQPNAVKQSADDALKPPPSMGNLMNGRHRRDSSLVSSVSSATVQIGLRLSSVEDMPPIIKNKVTTNDGKVYYLDCPEDRQKAKDAGLVNPKRPAPLITNMKPTPDDTDVEDESPKRDPVKDARMKTLPPVPRPGEAPVPDDLEETGETLSPSVYSPQSPTKAKLPSPRGVGFSVPGRGRSGSSPQSPPVAPPVHRPTGDVAKPGDWI